MAQTAEQKARRAAQRKIAARIKRGEAPLQGEFRRYVQQRLEHPVTPPPPVGPRRPAPTTESIEEQITEDYESIEADLFAQGRGTGEGAEQVIPLTYYPTATSYPSRLPQNKHPRTRAAGYNRLTETLAVRFWTPANLYYYYNVPTWMAREFRLTDSPGDYINDVLNGVPYERIE